MILIENNNVIITVHYLNCNLHPYPLELHHRKNEYCQTELVLNYHRVGGRPDENHEGVT